MPAACSEKRHIRINTNTNKININKNNDNQAHKEHVKKFSAFVSLANILGLAGASLVTLLQKPRRFRRASFFVPNCLMLYWRTNRSILCTWVVNAERGVTKRNERAEEQRGMRWKRTLNKKVATRTEGSRVAARSLVGYWNWKISLWFAYWEINAGWSPMNKLKQHTKDGTLSGVDHQKANV